MPWSVALVAPKRLRGATLGDESGGLVTLGDGAWVDALCGVANWCCGFGWKNSLSLSMPRLTGVPRLSDGVAGCGCFLSSWMRSSQIAVSLSSLDVSGIGNLVGRKMTFSTGMVARVVGGKTLHCL